jgi:hypothetical protein
MADIQISRLTATALRHDVGGLVTTSLGDPRLPQSFRELQHSSSVADYVDLTRRSSVEAPEPQEATVPPQRSEIPAAARPTEIPT